MAVNIYYNEDTLVQQTTAEYLKAQLGWDSLYAYNTETYGPDGTLGRDSDKEVVLTRYLREALIQLNPGLPDSAYDDAVRKITGTVASQTMLATNREKYELITNGVQVTFRNAEGDRVRERLKVLDFARPANNHFLCVRELWVKRRSLPPPGRPIVGFVNGLTACFSWNSKTSPRTSSAAYEQNFTDYKDTVPLTCFTTTPWSSWPTGSRPGSARSPAGTNIFNEWRRLAEDEPGAVNMETLLKGRLLTKRNFIGYPGKFHSCLMIPSGESRKILARNHQFLGVNRAIDAVQDNGKIGRGGWACFWHTQGAGKSYSMVFFTRKVHRKLGGNFTFVILTDREDLDTQIYKTFAGCGVVDNDRDPCRASSGQYLSTLLTEHKAYVFSLIQKFNQEVDHKEGYTDRNDVIVITDEAHRTQYGTLALNLRNALPHASYIGFTGTPLFSNDEITRRVFGEYISTYDFQRAVEDNATVPLYYDARGDKLGLAVGDLNERIAEKLEELETGDIDVEQRLEKELKRDYHIITAEKRLDQVAQDFVLHYSKAWETGKVMLVCIDKITCVRMHKLILKYWSQRIADLETELKLAADEQNELYRRRQTQWMKESVAAVVVSEEQGEVDKFSKWGLDIKPYRKMIKEGIDLPEAMRSKPQFRNLQRMGLEEAFKEEEHPFRIAIVCAMWLTGFDVPSLSTLYLDKPLKAHTLMQAIARANRVNEGKNNGLIVDYCGILKNLRNALATFGGQGDSGHGGRGGEQDPARPEEELLDDLSEAITFVRAFLTKSGASLDYIINKTGFERNAAILAAKEAANENDQTRKRFEVMCRVVFKKFKACINVKGVNNHRADYDAINVVYKSLQQDREQADISDIIRRLHKVVDDAIETNSAQTGHESDPYDISKIDFNKLRKEFESSPRQRTTVQSLKEVIEQRLNRLLMQNPLRTDFQQHYEEIVAEYNREKDRVTIEKTFEALLEFVKDLSDEEIRATREGLTDESLAIFDLLKKDDLSNTEIKRIKYVAIDLLEKLKSEKLKIDNWREKEATRDAVRTAIKDFLWDEETGLPVDSYDENDVIQKADDVFAHIFRAYPTIPSPFFSSLSA